jgi:hypothetical protein
VKQAATGVVGLLLALAPITARITAAVQLSLPSQSVASGGVALVPVMCASYNGPASAVQFDLLYDGNAISLGFTAGDAVRNSGKSLLAVDLAPGQKRFLITGLNQARPYPMGFWLTCSQP